MRHLYHFILRDNREGYIQHAFFKHPVVLAIYFIKLYAMDYSFLVRIRIVRADDEGPVAVHFKPAENSQVFVHRLYPVNRIVEAAEEESARHKVFVYARKDLFSFLFIGDFHDGMEGDESNIIPLCEGKATDILAKDIHLVAFFQL